MRLDLSNAKKGTTMKYDITPVDVWVGKVEDRPGGLSSKLAHLMMATGAHLEFIIARRSETRNGTGVLFVAPLTTPEEIAAAKDVDLHQSDSLHVLRLIGPDRAGLAAGVAGTLAREEINIAGISAMGAGEEAVVYIRLETAEDAERARTVIAEALAETP